MHMKPLDTKQDIMDWHYIGNGSSSIALLPSSAYSLWDKKEIFTFIGEKKIMNLQ